MFRRQMSVTASVYKKKVFTKRTVLAVVERLFGSWGRTLVAAAVVERFKQELMYGLSAGTKKCGRCREVAVVERWPLVEVRLYLMSQIFLSNDGLFKLHYVFKP